AWRWQAADGAGDASTDPGDNRCLLSADPQQRAEAAWDITRGWHGDGRLRMVPVTPQPTRATTDAFYPLILNSGR
ncbi:hypothetical protein CQA65_30660, partial [Klebsiella pneumoniae]